MSWNAPRNVVVVGGGIAGASISRVLARNGVKVTLLEKSNMLCSGSTWHAAGLVTRFGGSSKLKKIHVQSLSLLRELEDKYGIGLHLPGSIRVIEKNNEARLREAEQHVAMASLFDEPAFATELIDVQRVKELHPLVDVSDVECGVYTPCDGDVDPSLLTNVVAKEARSMGAEIRLNSHVAKIEPRGDSDVYGGGYIVHAESGGDSVRLECDAVVNAAGLWSRNVSEMGQLHHPAFVIEHQYAITETIDAVKALSKSGHNGGRLPVLRDLKGSSYIRQEGNGFLIGPYEDECVVRTDMPFGPPASFEMELFVDRLERIEDNLVQGMELVPCLGEVGFKSIVNGPTIWTGDSLARCGRSARPGWYDFNSLTYGIAQSLALSEYLGHIMLQGEQPADFDASDSFDPLRYGDWATDSFVEAKIKETYTHNNRVSFYSYENRDAGREHIQPAQYPLHAVLAEHGATFAPFGGSGAEVPLCYPSTTKNGESFHNAKRLSHFEWAPFAEAEAKHALEKVAVAYSSFSKLRVSGKDAKAFLGQVTTGVLPSSKNEDMPCRLTYCTTPNGQVCTEFTLCKLDKDGNDWYLVGSRDHVRQDIAWLSQQVGGRDVTITNLTDEVCVLHILGPDSGHLLGAIEPRVDNLEFMRARALKEFGNVPGLDVQVFRVSFSGEMGFELHFAAQDGPEVHRVLTTHPLATSLDLRHIGSAAINSLRIEKGFKFRADLDFSHFSEAGIQPFLAKKRDFLGKSTAQDRPPKRLSAMFTIDTDPGWEWSVVGDSPVKRRTDDKVVGYTTTSARGAITGKTVAIGFVNAEFQADQLEDLYIDTFGFKWPVKLLQQPIGGVNRDVWRAPFDLEKIISGY